MNPDVINLFSPIGMPKVVQTGSGTIVAPAATSTNSPQSNDVVIPHNLGTKDIIVSLTATFTYGSLSTSRVLAPWISNDGRKSLDVVWDTNNITIRASSSTAGSAESATTFNFNYNIIML